MIPKPRGKNQSGEYLAFDYDLYGDPNDRNEIQFEEQRARQKYTASSTKRADAEGIGAGDDPSTKRQKRQKRRNSKGEELGYDAFTFISGDPDEMQFEELRAKLYMAKLDDLRQREIPTLIAALPQPPIQSALPTPIAAVPQPFTMLQQQPPPPPQQPPPPQPLPPGVMMMTGPPGWMFDPGSTQNMSLCSTGYGTFSGSGTLGAGYPMNWGLVTASSMSGVIGGVGSDNRLGMNSDVRYYGDNGVSAAAAAVNESDLAKTAEIANLMAQQPQQPPLKPVNPLLDEHAQRVFEKLQEVELRHKEDGKFVEVSETLDIAEGMSKVTIKGDAEYIIDTKNSTIVGEHTQYIALRRSWNQQRRKYVTQSHKSGTKAILDGGDDDDLVTLKVGVGQCYVEWYIYRVLSERCQGSPSFFEEFDRGYFFKNKSMLVTPGCAVRTFQNIIHEYQARKLMVPEVLTMYLALGLLDAVDSLHRADVIHLDIQPSTIGVSGDGNIFLLDYHHAVDRRLYPPGQLYEWDLQSTFFDCAEMLEKKPWGFQIDNHGIAISIYCLLMIEWPEFDYDPERRRSGGYAVRFKGSLQHGRQTEIWDPMLNTLLNSRDDTDLIKCGMGIRMYFEKNPFKVKEAQEMLNTVFLNEFRN